MTDFEKMVSVFTGKEEFEIKPDKETGGSNIIFANEFGMSFDKDGAFKFSFNFKW